MQSLIFYIPLGSGPRKKIRQWINKQRKDVNLVYFRYSCTSLIDLFYCPIRMEYNSSAILGWHLKNWNLSQWILLGLVAAIIFGAWFARRMKTNHLIAITLSSIFVAYLAESFGPWANWWIYPLEVQHPLNNNYASRDNHSGYTYSHISSIYNTNLYNFSNRIFLLLKPNV